MRGPPGLGEGGRVQNDEVPLPPLFLQKPVREKEGLIQSKDFFPLSGETAPCETVTEITENGVKYTVDFENGQKTGFFLDQKYNRAWTSRGKSRSFRVSIP